MDFFYKPVYRSKLHFRMRTNGAVDFICILWKKNDRYLPVLMDYKLPSLCGPMGAEEEYMITGGENMELCGIEKDDIIL